MHSKATKQSARSTICLWAENNRNSTLLIKRGLRREPEGLRNRFKDAEVGKEPAENNKKESE
jgi:hypothetical protein